RCSTGRSTSGASWCSACCCISSANGNDSDGRPLTLRPAGEGHSPRSTRSMRVGIDYTAAAWQGAGIGRYTRDLVREILALGGQYRYTLFYAAGWPGAAVPYQDELDRLCAAHPNVRAAPIPLPPRRLTQLWHRLRAPIPVELFTGPLDVLHEPDFVLPPT